MKRCKKEYIPFLAGMLVVLLALSRYIVNGEPVDVRSDAADLADGITLSDGIEIMQPLTIPVRSTLTSRKTMTAAFFLIPVFSISVSKNQNAYPTLLRYAFCNY